ncbi:MAG: HEAT repeat domain-containing protein [Methanosphaera sp.]|nr:HEAT repeat domain-containing protein [Methanosphaera sp.]
MGLFDKFKKPKWQHKDPKVRLKAVKELNDQKILGEIVKNAPYFTENSDEYEVGRAALKRIDDEEVLGDIAINADFTFGEIAVSKIKDKSILEKVAKGHAMYEIRQYAIKEIDNEEVLKEIAADENSAYSVREYARIKLNSKTKDGKINNDELDKIEERKYYKTLLETAKTDFSETRRVNAVNQIINRKILPDSEKDSILLDIFINSEYKDTKKIAIKNIKNEDTINNFAKNTNYSWMDRKEVIEIIDDESTLIYIAKNDSDFSVRQSAIKKIHDESILIDIVKNDSKGSVRCEAVENINDESVLINIAKNDSSSSVRKAAVEKINNESVLIDTIFDVTENDGDFSLHNTALNRLRMINPNSIASITPEEVSEINNQSKLINIAKNAADYSSRIEAVRNINDESTLIDIAKNDPYWRVRVDAVEKISDESTLIDIAKNDSYSYEKERIEDTEQWYNVVREGTCYPVCEAAKARLKTLGYE